MIHARRGALPCGLFALLFSAAGLGQVLHDNGPLLTGLGNAASGADSSAVQAAANQTVTGYAASRIGDTALADNFSVPAGGWQVHGIRLYAYQTGADASSPSIEGARVRIWDGIPEAPGSAMVHSFDSDLDGTLRATPLRAFRVMGMRLEDRSRPLLEIGIGLPAVALPAGSYWLEWSLAGSVAAGPYVPPVTRVAEAGSGNALQRRGDSWQPLAGTGAGEELPFRLLGADIFDDGFEG